MKRILFALFLLSISLFALVACGDNHEHDYKAEATSATCEKEGYTVYTCECGDTYKADHVNPLGHDIQVHNYKEPTCTEDGNQEYNTCSRCDYTTFVPISAKGHTYNDETFDATCTEKGYTLYTCSCGDSYKDSYIDEFGHSIEIDQAKEATCTETGLSEGKHCSICDEVLVEQTIVAKKGHTEVIDEAVAPTCTTTGLTEGKHCSACNEVLVEQEEIPTKHNFVDYVCSDCNETYLTFTLSADEQSYSVKKGTASVSEITIPSTYNGKPVTTITQDAFFNSTALTKIVIPDSITTMEKWIFSQCESLTTIIVDSNNPYFDSRDNCNAIIKTADNSLILGCKNTTIPSSVVNIADDAFAYTNIEKITIPSNVEWIGNKAFYYCKSLTDVTMEYGLTLIGTAAFEECELLANVTIPNSVTTILPCAFRLCDSLTSIEIPDSVTSLGWGALSYCNLLASVKLSSNLSVIEEQLFAYCYVLTDVSIPNGVLSIGPSAFTWCNSLTGITIPNSVVTIEGSAFYSCKKLTAVSFGNNISTIGDQAFYDCTSLEIVYYTLSEDRWKMVDISTWNNSYLTNAQFVYNNSGDN